MGGLALILSLQMAATAPISLLNPLSPSNPKVPTFFQVFLALSILKIVKFLVHKSRNQAGSETTQEYQSSASYNLALTIILSSPFGWK